MSPLIVYFFVFISVSAAVALMCLLFIRDESAVQLRLNELTHQSSFDVRPPQARAGRSLVTAIRSALASFGSWAHPTAASPVAARLQFIRAGIYAPSASSVMTAVRLMMMLVPMAIGLAAVAVYGIDLRLVLMGGAPIAVAGMYLPAFWLAQKTKKRKLILNRSLPDFLDVMIVCLESGMSFESALQRTSEELQEAHPKLAGELGIVQREIALGQPVENALENFAFRANLDVVRLLAVNVQQSRRLGVRLADNLRTHADILRTKRENRAEELAQKAAVKILMPTLLFIFPTIFVVLVGPAFYQVRDTFLQQREAQLMTDDELLQPGELSADPNASY